MLQTPTQFLYSYQLISYSVIAMELSEVITGLVSQRQSSLQSDVPHRASVPINKECDPCSHNMSYCCLQDLTGTVRKTDKYYFANGGLADVWKGEWSHGTSRQLVKRIFGFGSLLVTSLFTLLGSGKGHPKYLEQCRLSRAAQDGKPINAAHSGR
jgi:hypothetical protein